MTIIDRRAAWRRRLALKPPQTPTWFECHPWITVAFVAVLCTIDF